MGHRGMEKKLEEEMKSRKHFSFIWENNSMLLGVIHQQ